MKVCNVKKLISLVGLVGFALTVGGAEGRQELRHRSELFPEMKGWKRLDSTRVYNAANLYDYIDGAADVFLSYEFQELRVADYESAGGGLVTVEIYRHKSPVDAFGIYSRERPTEGPFLEISEQGYYREGILNFVQGAAYVKIASINVRENMGGQLREFAQKVSDRLGTRTGLPRTPSQRRGRRL